LESFLILEDLAKIESVQRLGDFQTVKRDLYILVASWKMRGSLVMFSIIRKFTSIGEVPDNPEDYR